MKAPFTVSQLNQQVKNWLETEIGEVEVTGEISNFSRPQSGHIYFSLKDQQAQIRCVFFRNHHTRQNTDISDGTQVILKGYLSLYEARGDYQLIVREIRVAGDGALLRQFYLLKNKLEQEGLFDPGLKRPLPCFPNTIGIITSATGAALQDIITTLKRRYPLAKVYLYPSEVQGSSARKSLLSTLTMACNQAKADVLILARGGGSIEDLQAFNDEDLARLIRRCPFPVVAGIGHETDFTIADFAADYRAPTPTGAAEAVTPDRRELNQHLEKDIFRLQRAMFQNFNNASWQLERLSTKLNVPQTRLQQLWQRIDRASMEMLQIMSTAVQKEQHTVRFLMNSLHNLNPRRQLELMRSQLVILQQMLNQTIDRLLKNFAQRLKYTGATLHTVSPLATLDRGYSITTSNTHVVYDSKDVHVHDILEVRLKYGSLLCEVLKKMETAND